MNINRSTYPSTSYVQYFVNGVVDNTTIRNSIFSGQTNRLATSLDPIESPTIFSFSSNILNGGNQQESEVYIDFSTNPVINEIEFFTTTFTPADTNLDANQFYSSTAPGITIQERIESLVLAINSNLNLNWRYSAQNFNNTAVKIFAKYPGSIYNLASPNLVCTPDFTFSYTAGIDRDRGMLLQNHDYKCFVEIWEIENVEWNRFGFRSDPALGNRQQTLIATMSQTWTTSNQFIFDVSKFLNNIVYNNSQYLNLSSQFNIKQDTIKCYYLKWGESFIGGYDPTTDLPIDTPWNITNNFVTKRYQGETELRWCSQGVYPLANTRNNHSQYWLSEYYNTISTNNQLQTIKALTTFNGLYKLRRRIDQPEYLSYYVMNDQSFSSNFQLRLRHQWTDWGGNTLTTYTSTSNCNENGMYVVNVSNNLIGLPNVELSFNNRILFWSTTLEANFNGTWVYYSEPTYYKLDLNTELENTYNQLFWINEFGSLDTFTFEGLFIENLDQSFDQYNKTIKNIDNERWKHINGIINKRTKSVYKLNSGYLVSKDLQKLKSLLNSTQVWIVDSSNYSSIISNVRTDRSETYFQSINITGNNFSDDDSLSIYNLEITFEVAINQNTQY